MVYSIPKVDEPDSLEDLKKSVVISIDNSANLSPDSPAIVHLEENDSLVNESPESHSALAIPSPSLVLASVDNFKCKDCGFASQTETEYNAHEGVCHVKRGTKRNRSDTSLPYEPVKTC